MMRTFRRSDLEASRAEWDQGEFSDEWKPWRHRAAMRGMIYPPSGTNLDSWEDEEPSQRAILIRAIRETPKLLASAIDTSRNWHDVVAKIMRAHEDFRETANRAARQREWDRDEADPHEASVVLKRIIERIRES